MQYMSNGVDHETGEVMPHAVIGSGHVTSAPEESNESIGRLQTLLSAALERNAAADERLAKASKAIAELHAKVASLELQVSEKREHFHRQFALAQQKFSLIPVSIESSFPTKNGSEMTLSYADLGVIVDAIRPILGEFGLSLRQPVLDHPTDPSMTTVQTILACDGYEEVVSSFSFSTVKRGGDFKELGSAVTYVRRYTLAASLGLATESKISNQRRSNTPKGGFGRNSRSNPHSVGNEAGYSRRQFQESQQAAKAQTTDQQRPAPNVSQVNQQAHSGGQHDIENKIRTLPFTEVVELINRLNNDERRQYKALFDERRAQHQAQMHQAA